MTLQDKLNEYKAQFESSLPPEALPIMHRATEDLRHSGIIERVLKIGDRVPEFALPNAQGQIVSSAKLLEKGPLVVSFYRGVW
jgi:AhpC/TSA family